MLPLLAVTVVSVMVIKPLRETLTWASPTRPEPQQIRGELNAALEQVYRSFVLNDEAATYDRIAQSITGDAIRDIYLEVRRSLLDEDSEHVVIDRVQVQAVDDIEWQTDGGCRLDATWTVRGNVGHFGHFHERQNRYRARIDLLPRSAHGNTLNPHHRTRAGVVTAMRVEVLGLSYRYRRGDFCLMVDRLVVDSGATLAVVGPAEVARRPCCTSLPACSHRIVVRFASATWNFPRIQREGPSGFSNPPLGTYFSIIRIAAPLKRRGQYFVALPNDADPIDR